MKWLCFCSAPCYVHLAMVLLVRFDLWPLRVQRALNAHSMQGAAEPSGARLHTLSSCGTQPEQLQTHSAIDGVIVQ